MLDKADVEIRANRLLVHKESYVTNVLLEDGLATVGYAFDGSGG